MLDLSYYNKKNIFITGACGYLGTEIIKKLKDIPCRILALYQNEKDNKLNYKNIEYVQGDIRNLDIWEKYLPKIDIVFHLAAQTSSKISNEDPKKDFNLNLLPTLYIIYICKKNKLKPDIVYSGSATEVGITEKFPVDENFNDNPCTIYDIHKFASEKYLYFYHQFYGRSVILRLSNVYGPGALSSSQDRGIVNSLVRKALQGHALTLFGNGNYIRDYIFIDDVVNAFLLAGIYIKKISGKYFIISSGKGTTLKEMFQNIVNLIDTKISKKIDIKSISWPDNISPIEKRNFIGNSRAFQKLTGWKVRISLKEGITNTIEYFLRK